MVYLYQAADRQAAQLCDIEAVAQTVEQTPEQHAQSPDDVDTHPRVADSRFSTRRLRSVRELQGEGWGRGFDQFPLVKPTYLPCGQINNLHTGLVSIATQSRQR